MTVKGMMTSEARKRREERDNHYQTLLVDFQRRYPPCETVHRNYAAARAAEQQPDDDATPATFQACQDAARAIYRLHAVIDQTQRELTDLADRLLKAGEESL